MELNLELAARIADIVQLKYKGVSTDMARHLGWSQPYLAKLLRGESIGIAPITAMLEAYPDINARWLLFGEGNMLSAAAAVKQQLNALIELEQYMPVMSPEELNLLTEGKTDWDTATLQRWQKQLSIRKAASESRLATLRARQKQKELKKATKKPKTT